MTLCQLSPDFQFGHCVGSLCADQHVSQPDLPLVTADCAQPATALPGTDWLNCFDDEVQGYGTCYAGSCHLRCVSDSDCSQVQGFLGELDAGTALRCGKRDAGGKLTCSASGVSFRDLRARGVVVPLKVTWTGNEAGAAIPLAVLDPTTVTVVILDETGAPSPVAHELEAKLCRGGSEERVDFTDVVVAGGSAKQGTLYLAPRWFWRLPRLELTARRLDGTGKPMRRDVVVVTRPMLWPSWIAMLVGGVGLLYTLAIFPQLKALPTLISPGPWAGAFAIFLVAAQALRVRVLGHLANPLIGAAAAVIAFGLSVAVVLNATLVVNRSIEKFSASVLELDATDYTVLWGEPPLDKGFCRGADDGASSASCVQFDSPATFWFPFAKRFVRRVFSVGCTPLPLFAGHKAFWKAQKQCVPGDPPPPVLERMAPGEAFESVHGRGRPRAHRHGDRGLPRRRLRVRAPQAGRLRGPRLYLARGCRRRRGRRRRSRRQRGRRQWGRRRARPGRPRASHDGHGRRAGDHGEPPGRPRAHAGPGSRQPRASGHAPVVGARHRRPDGRSGRPDDPVRAGDHRPAPRGARASQRRARLSLHGGRAGLREALSGLLGRGRPPSYGEIRLDPAWSPSVGWSIVLGDRAVAESIAVLDGAGKSIGQLQCRGARTGGRWTIGPLRVDSPSGAFGVVWLGDDKAPTWVAAAGHEDDPWPWACWRDVPPPRLHGARGLFGARSGNLGFYRVSPTLRECRYYQNGDPVPPEDRCSPAVDADVASRWYRGAYAPAGDCDPRLWKLCPGPLKGKDAR